jgi:hypothetical protein
MIVLFKNRENSNSPANHTIHTNTIMAIAWNNPAKPEAKKIYL